MVSKDPNIFFSKSNTSKLARSIDWDNHPLGPTEGWDLSLKTSISVAMSSKFPMFVTWGEEKYFFYNDAYALILGQKHPSAFGDKFQNIWPEIWNDLIPLISSVENDEAVFLEDLELVMNRFGYEETTYFTFSYSPIRSSKGRIEGLFCAVVETTGRVTAERELKSRETELVSILEGMSDAFLTIDKNWIIKRVNAQFEEVIKVKRNEVIGKNFLELYFNSPEFQNSLYVKTYRKVMQDRVADSFVDYYEPFDIWTAVSVYPTEDGGIAIFFREISEERRAAQELKDAVKSRDEFISIASHELKTPLTTLKLQAQLQQKLGDSYPKDKLEQNNLKLVKLVDRLDRLVEDMLDISRIRTGKLTMHKSENDLVQLCHEVIEGMQTSFISATGSTVCFDAPESAISLVDRFRIEQVIYNLLQNALKYGKGEVVKVTLVDGPENILISVSDRGIGIESDNFSRIFDRFERAIGANEISGLGLGLFITKEIVIAHQGKIWVESEVNKGSTFNVLLPKC